MREKFRAFMQGRYGGDQLSIFLLVAYGVLFFISRLANSFLLLLLGLAAGIFCIYRILSRNIAARRKENADYQAVAAKVVSYFKRDRKHYHYYHCPKCKVTVKVPKGKGKIAITCPKCREEFIKKS